MAKRRQSFLATFLLTLGFLLGRVRDGHAQVTAVPPSSSASATQDVSLVVGVQTSCILLASGEVRCWGNNEETNFTAANVSKTNKPLRVSLPQPARRLRANGNRICALLVDGSVHCWGYWPSVDRSRKANKSPTLFATDATDITVGDSFACALHTGGTVSCWGNNNRGQLGNGTKVERDQTLPIPGLSNVVHLAADAQTCALLRDGTLRCWGMEEVEMHPNAEGYDGPALGLLPPRAVPTLIDVANVRALRIGPRLVCVLYVNGSASCYGGMLARQAVPSLLERKVGNASDPLRVVVPVAWKNLQDIVFGEHVRCWIQGRGSPRCRDDDKEHVSPEDRSITGDGDHTFAGDSTIQLYLHNVRQIAVTESHRCALLNGTDEKGMPKVSCWGLNRTGEVGKPSQTEVSMYPEVIKRPFRVTW